MGDAFELQVALMKLHNGAAAIPPECPDGWTMVRTGFYNNLLGIAGEKALAAAPASLDSKLRELSAKWRQRSAYYSKLSGANNYFEAKPRCYEECADELDAFLAGPSANEDGAGSNQGSGTMAASTRRNRGVS